MGWLSVIDQLMRMWWNSRLAKAYLPTRQTEPFSLVLPADEAFELLLEVTGAAGAEDMAAGAPGVNVQHSGGLAAPVTMGAVLRGGERGWAGWRIQHACCAAGLNGPVIPKGRPARLKPAAPHQHSSPPTSSCSAAKGATPLMAAAVHGRDDVVSTLLSNGVSAGLIG